MFLLPSFAAPSQRRVHRSLWLWRLLAAVLLSTSAAGCASLPANPARPATQAFAAPEQTALGQLTQLRRAQASARSDSAFYLLDSIDAAFSSRLALIERAQKSLDLQYYAVHADASTELLLQRIREAARRGVRVRLLLDDFNTVGEDAQVLRLGFESNVEIRLFNPLAGARSSLPVRVLSSLKDVERIQKRMHNKLFLADSAWGIAGGRNLGDAYFGGDDKSNFVDLDVLATGPIVRQMEASFDRYWNDELSYPMKVLLEPNELDKLQADAPARTDAAARPPTLPASSAAVPKTAPVKAVSANTVLPGAAAAAAVGTRGAPMDLQRVPLAWAPAVLMADQPEKIGASDDEANASETVVDGLLTLMNQAREEVLIVSPYFVPGARMMAAFEQLRGRGVRVRVLTNSLASNDAVAAHAGYARYRGPLLGMGVELYEMRAEPPRQELRAGAGRSLGSGISLGSGPGGSKSGASRTSLHSKAVIIDRRFAVIGSMNLDLRSKLKNSEIALLIRSPALAREAARLVETTLGSGAYRLEASGQRLLWRAPPGASFTDSTVEPEASMGLRVLVNLLGPFAPDEML